MKIKTKIIVIVLIFCIVVSTSIIGFQSFQVHKKTEEIKKLKLEICDKGTEIINLIIKETTLINMLKDLGYEIGYETIDYKVEKIELDEDANEQKIPEQ